MVVAQARKTTVSNILNISDEWLAFCLDEAVEYIRSRVKDGEKPQYVTEKPQTLSEFYSSLNLH